MASWLGIKGKEVMPVRALFFISLFLLLTGCADSVSFQEAEMLSPVGFWHGLWHGLILLPAWIISLFTPDVAIYAIYNNGGWYDFGYVLGAGGLTLSVGFAR